jgi:uncharacterized phage protein (TIGR02218 family)
MRTPLWESSAGALASLLNTRTDLVVFDLYTLTLPGGTVLRWSGTDARVTVNGTSWLLGPGFKRGRTRLSVGIAVDTLEVTVFADASITVSGTPLLQYIAKGGFDNARLQIDRAYKGRGDVAVVGTLLWFVGRVADTKGDRTQARLNVKSDTELLDVMVPREVYQPGCTNTLYDPSCGVSRAAKTVTGSATSASDATRTSFSHALGQAAGYFDLGVVSFSSGANAGIGRTVKRHTSGALAVLSPFPFPVASGDSFSIYPGCDKTQATCTAKFSNVIRFRGHPYIPAPETIT